MIDLSELGSGDENYALHPHADHYYNEIISRSLSLMIPSPHHQGNLLFHLLLPLLQTANFCMVQYQW
jgi:hypothetical protein